MALSERPSLRATSLAVRFGPSWRYSEKAAKAWGFRLAGRFGDGSALPVKFRASRGSRWERVSRRRAGDSAPYLPEFRPATRRTEHAGRLCYPEEGGVVSGEALAEGASVWAGVVAGGAGSGLAVTSSRSARVM